MHARRLPLAGALILGLCLIGAGCASDSPTTPDQQAADAPLLDGPGWFGGGGRMPSDSTSTGTTPPDSTNKSP